MRKELTNYRKKPIVIKAYQTDIELDIETLEGTMHANVGDYIITGVNGEKYPCKPDIFEKTYEKVVENNNDNLSPLEAFKDVCLAEVNIGGGCTMPFYKTKQYNIIETALKEYQTLKKEYDFGVEHYKELEALYNKEHKALEIIKERIIIKSKTDYTDFYLEFSLPKHGKGMTQHKEQIKLLKEVLL